MFLGENYKERNRLRKINQYNKYPGAVQTSIVLNHHIYLATIPFKYTYWLIQSFDCTS